MQGAPKYDTFGGLKIEPSAFCNPKGSVSPEMLMKHLKFIDTVREHHGRPDAEVLVLMDGVQTHVTVAMLEFMATKKLVLGLRPPNTSHLLQNEDLLSFLVFRNDSEVGYNKVKQTRLAFIMTEKKPRYSLGFQDAMAVIRPGWDKMMSKEVQQKAWEMGGVNVFSRLPQRLLERTEAMEQRPDRRTTVARSRGASLPGADATTGLAWNAMIASAPTRHKVFAKGNEAAEGSDDEGGEVDLGGGNGARLDAAMLHNLDPVKHINASFFKQSIRQLKSMSVQELQDEGAMLASKYTDFKFSYPKRGEGTRTTAELTIYRQHAAMFGFEADLYMPAYLVKEKKRQRGEDPDAEDAAPQPAAKKLSSIELLAKAAALRPAGAQYLSLPTIATPAGPVAAGAVEAAGAAHPGRPGAAPGWWLAELDGRKAAAAMDVGEQ
jgi:hypothetical protein